MLTLWGRRWSWLVNWCNLAAMDGWQPSSSNLMQSARTARAPPLVLVELATSSFGPLTCGAFGPRRILDNMQRPQNKLVRWYCLADTQVCGAARCQVPGARAGTCLRLTDLFHPVTCTYNSSLYTTLTRDFENWPNPINLYELVVCRFRPRNCVVLCQVSGARCQVPGARYQPWYYSEYQEARFLAPGGTSSCTGNCHHLPRDNFSIHARGATGLVLAMYSYGEYPGVQAIIPGIRVLCSPSTTNDGFHIMLPAYGLPNRVNKAIE
jgi:hypothetical protein